jgi:hypothetical protein
MTRRSRRAAAAALLYSLLAGAHAQTCAQPGASGSALLAQASAPDAVAYVVGLRRELHSMPEVGCVASARACRQRACASMHQCTSV